MKSIFINQTSYIDPDVYKVGVIIFIIIMVMAFILIFLKKILEHKLKNKMLDKGVPETLVASILQKDPNSGKHNSMKWFFVLLGIGIGLCIVNYTLPLGIHSFAIMALSISMSFLCHYFYLQRYSE